VAWHWEEADSFDAFAAAAAADSFGVVDSFDVDVVESFDADSFDVVDSFGVDSFGVDSSAAVAVPDVVYMDIGACTREG
jgi:hypothetical protein